MSPSRVLSHLPTPMGKCPPSPGPGLILPTQKPIPPSSDNSTPVCSFGKLLGSTEIQISEEHRPRPPAPMQAALSPETPSRRPLPPTGIKLIFIYSLNLAPEIWAQTFHCHPTSPSGYPTGISE